MNKEIEISRLLETTRMFYNPFKPQNSVCGLYDLIKENVNESTVMVEVGSFAGVSSELFALHCHKISCIDSWKPYIEIPSEFIIEAEARFEKVRLRYDNISKLKFTSSEAAPLFLDNCLDLVYIDAAHDYESIKNDINLWLPKIKPGGFIAGHDIVLKPVKFCIDEIFGENNYKTYPDTSWIFKVPE